MTGMKIKSGKNIFRKLNEHSKELQAKQEEIIKKHNSLLKQYDELQHLKNNMNKYLGGIKQRKKSWLLVILENTKFKNMKNQLIKREI